MNKSLRLVTTTIIGLLMATLCMGARAQWSIVYDQMSNITVQAHGNESHGNGYNFIDTSITGSQGTGDNVNFTGTVNAHDTWSGQQYPTYQTTITCKVYEYVKADPGNPNVGTGSASTSANSSTFGIGGGSLSAPPDNQRVISGQTIPVYFTNVSIIINATSIGPGNVSAKVDPVTITCTP